MATEDGREFHVELERQLERAVVLTTCGRENLVEKRDGMAAADYLRNKYAAKLSAGEVRLVSITKEDLEESPYPIHNWDPEE
jgi:hypothetical protein